MKKTRPDDWQPADRLALETNALTAIRSPGNTLVVAGPGAGKTELLAQKACYLLQTSTCPYPKRILAISFKRDAAYNLKERVKLRCGDIISRRFDSYTFDAFAKQLLDRFHNALPKDYKIRKDYQIFFDSKTIDDTFRAIDVKQFSTVETKWNKYLTESSLPFNNGTAAERFRIDAWKSLTTGKKCLLNFQMIMRLAELIMNTNPRLKHFLQKTYSHVFLDEFQDTTQKQYDFLQSCFAGSGVNYTAVGDDKQRIMGWAGAVTEIFDTYQTDAHALRLPLLMNFRSAPKLVELQNYLVKELLHKTEIAIPAPKWQPDEGEALLWIFKDPSSEMRGLHENIVQWMREDVISCRDICILIKGNLSVYAGGIIEYLNANGVQARDEGEFQEFLTEEVVVFIIAFIYILIGKGSSEHNDIVFSFLANLNSSFEDHQLLRLHAEVLKYIKDNKKRYDGLLDDNAILNLVVDILNFAVVGKIKNTYTQYKNGVFFKETVMKFIGFLQKEYKDKSSILNALGIIEGKDSIPVMTIHKSKGLEYHTVIFVGLEDGAFWSYKTQADEDKNAFFVALSRAKERVLFTFSKKRVNKWEKLVDNSTSVIKEIVEKLESSGVVEIEEYEGDSPSVSL